MPEEKKGNSEIEMKDPVITFKSKAQRKRLSDNPYLGSRGFFESDREYNRRRIAAELWKEGYGPPEK